MNNITRYIKSCLFFDGIGSGFCAWTLNYFFFYLGFLIGVPMFDFLTLKKLGPYSNSAKIINKKLEPEYYINMITIVNNMPVANFIYHPPKYLVTLQFQNTKENVITDNKILFEQKETELKSISYYDVQRFSKHIRYEIAE